jgi:hypothetical protein
MLFRSVFSARINSMDAAGRVIPMALAISEVGN